jgi:hypothetical protein
VSQPLPRYRPETSDERGRVDKAIGEAQDRIVTTVARATLPGDSRRLRGIPCIARGVTAAPNPLTLIIAAELRAARRPPSDAQVTIHGRRTAQVPSLPPTPESEPLTATMPPLAPETGPSH